MNGDLYLLPPHGTHERMERLRALPLNERSNLLLREARAEEALRQSRNVWGDKANKAVLYAPYPAFSRTLHCG